MALIAAGAVADRARRRRAPVLGAQRPLDQAQIATLPSATVRRLAPAQQRVGLRALRRLLDAAARGERRRREPRPAAAPLQTTAMARHGQGDKGFAVRTRRSIRLDSTRLFSCS